MSERSPKRQTVTMYMHLLDGKPAVFCAGRAESEHYIAFAGQRLRFSDLVPSLRQIRREQATTCANAYAWSQRFPAQAEWANRHRYGYVRVEVPRV